MLYENLILICCGILMLSAAFAVISLKNPVYSVLCLIIVFFIAACLLLLLDTEFLAMVLLIVYIGAIAVLFLFVVMMIKIKGLEVNLDDSNFKFGHMCNLLLIIFFFEISFVIAYLNLDILDLHYQEITYSNVITLVNKLTNIEVIGLVIYTYYFPIFLVASLVLLVAMIGSIILTLSNKTNIKKQNLFEQQVRNYKNTLILKQYKSY